jgi:hypothetical protein
MGVQFTEQLKLIANCGRRTVSALVLAKWLDVALCVRSLGPACVI